MLAYGSHSRNGGNAVLASDSQDGSVLGPEFWVGMCEEEGGEGLLHYIWYILNLERPARRAIFQTTRAAVKKALQEVSCSSTGGRWSFVNFLFRAAGGEKAELSWLLPPAKLVQILHSERLVNLLQFTFKEDDIVLPDTLLGNDRLLRAFLQQSLPLLTEVWGEEDANEDSPGPEDLDQSARRLSEKESQCAGEIKHWQEAQTAWETEVKAVWGAPLCEEWCRLAAQTDELHTELAAIEAYPPSPQPQQGRSSLHAHAPQPATAVLASLASSQSQHLSNPRAVVNMNALLQSISVERAEDGSNTGPQSNQANGSGSTSRVSVPLEDMTNSGGTADADSNPAPPRSRIRLPRSSSTVTSASFDNAPDQSSQGGGGGGGQSQLRRVGGAARSCRPMSLHSLLAAQHQLWGSWCNLIRQCQDVAKDKWESAAKGGRDKDCLEAEAALDTLDDICGMMNTQLTGVEDGDAHDQNEDKVTGSPAKASGGSSDGSAPENSVELQAMCTQARKDIHDFLLVFLPSKQVAPPDHLTAGALPARRMQVVVAQRSVLVARRTRLAAAAEHGLKSAARKLLTILLRMCWHSLISAFHNHMSVQANFQDSFELLGGDSEQSLDELTGESGGSRDRGGLGGSSVKDVNTLEFQIEELSEELSLALAKKAEAEATLEAVVAEKEEILQEFTCPVCLYERKRVAFSCGHCTCANCSLRLKNCCVCRQEITMRLTLF